MSESTAPAGPASAPAEAPPTTEAAPAAPATDSAPAASASAPAAEAGPAAEAASAPVADSPSVPEKSAKSDSLTTDITAGPGGVMTDEVGVITGDLTLRTDFAGGKVTVNVQYKDAEEWYVVTGGKAQLKDAADAAAVHKIVAGVLNRPEG